MPGVFDEKQYGLSSTSFPYYNKTQVDFILKETETKPVDFVLSGEWAAGFALISFVI